MSVTFNERQLQAIEHVRGPMLVVAGAGTGKTSVLVERIARLVCEGHARAQGVPAPGWVLSQASRSEAVAVPALHSYASGRSES